MPLKNIPAILSPQLLCTLAEMGHGDEIVLADAHFPTSSVCKSLGAREVRADGIAMPALLEAIAKVLPLDAYVEQPAAVMAVADSDKKRGMANPHLWKEYQQILNAAEGKDVKIEEVERFAFYERAKKAFAVVHTGETAVYANIILKKGVAKC